jgi:hypothetical protein
MTCVSCKKSYSEEFLKNSCDAPCWNGIEIGMTKDDVLRELTLEKRIEVSEKKFNDRIEYLTTSLRNRKEIITFQFKDNLLTNINHVFMKGAQRKLDFALEKFGVPSFVLGTYSTHVFTYNKVFLCYLEEGIQIELGGEFKSESPFHNYEVNENSTVWTINYFNPSEYGQAYNSYYACLVPDKKEYISHDWHGYGKYATCDPETMDWCGE